jgi:hypothetical protein
MKKKERGDRLQGTKKKKVNEAKIQKKKENLEKTTYNMFLEKGQSPISTSPASILLIMS